MAEPVLPDSSQNVGNGTSGFLRLKNQITMKDKWIKVLQYFGDRSYGKYSQWLVVRNWWCNETWVLLLSLKSTQMNVQYYLIWNLGLTSAYWAAVRKVNE